MAQFIEVTPQNGNSKIIINSGNIKSVVTDLNSKTLIHFLNTESPAKEPLMVRESYEDIKKKVGL